MAQTPWEAAKESAERIAVGKKPRPEADFATGLWWAALVNLLLTAGLLATVKLWARRLSDIASGRGFAVAKMGRGFVVALLAIVVLGGVMRWNLAHRGLWHDELWGVKFGVVGYYLGEPTDPLEDRYFGEATWQRALWHYTRPSNHPAATFPARLSYLVWKAVTHPEKPNAFSEFAIRFPNWLAALASIAAVGLLGALWGRPLAGLIAALVLAMHPWHIRYGIDLRGYTWVVLWTAMGLVWLTLLFREGRSRWWLWWAIGLNQALLVWAFPHAAVVAMAFFVIGGLLIFQSWSNAGDRRSACWRWLLVNVAGGMVFLQLFAPNLLQMRGWYTEVKENHPGHGLDGRLLSELLGDWFTGMPWVLPKTTGADGLVDLTGRAGSFLWPALAVIAAALVIGAWRLWRAQKRGFLMLGAVLLAGVGLLAFFGVTQTFFYPRFLIFLLVPLALLIGMAGDWQQGNRRLRVLVAASTLGLLGWLVMPQWGVLMSRPYAPIRDLTGAFEAIQDESDQPVIFGCYGHGLEMFPVYFPEIRDVITLADLQQLIAEAKERGARLVMTYGYEGYNRASLADGYTWLDDPAHFRLVKVWPGIESEHVFYQLEWTGKD
ncbi:MAG: hypothetical protein KDN20_14100 [Verrucomicrobiae bacterium]|nr:hypothetical protein [Verrucomicrobiae bacterium]